MAEITIHRSLRFMLHPTKDQAERLGQFIGVTRLVYNLALEQRSTFYRQYRRVTGRGLSYMSQGLEVTKLRAEFDWVSAVPADNLTEALKDLDGAFNKFFAGGGYPSFRSRGRNDTTRFKGSTVAVRQISRKWAQVRLSKIGWVKFRSTREVLGRITSATVKDEGGKWSITVGVSSPAEAALPAASSVGIDRGIATTLALSTGEMFTLPAKLVRLDQQRRHAQRIVARRKKGSNRRRAQVQKVAVISSRIQRVRGDWLHRQSTAIAQRHGFVAIEALKIKNMAASAAGTVTEPGKHVAQKRGLNRSIMAQGWGIFARQLAYKIEERGGYLAFVNPAYTSQTCSACGVVDAASRKSQAVFLCVHCGHEEHADVGAAKEILRRSTSDLKDVEGSRWRPAEASTRETVQ